MLPLVGANGRQRKKTLLIIAQVSASVLWMLLSSALIILNQHLMVRDGFRYPMALSGMGMAFSSVAAFLACRVFKLIPTQKKVSWGFYMKNMMPVGLFMAGTLACGNLVYLLLSVSLIQMLKAFTPVITMLCLFVARLETPSHRLVASVLVITLGTVLATYGDIQLRALGLVVMFTSELLESVRLVMTQYLMKGCSFHPIESLMYLAPSCTFWLMVGSLIFESSRMRASGALEYVAAKPAMYFAAAAMGFCVNASSFFVIKLTSSLSLKILGTVKNAAVVGYAAVVLRETVTLLQGVGYSIGVAGFMWYTQIQ